MILCFKISLCFYVILSLGFLDASNDSVILDGNVHGEVNGLLSSDGSVKATQKEKDIRLSGTGRINLTLDYGELVFEVCPNFNCAEKSKVCFETTETSIQTKLECSGIPSYCTFEVHKEGEQIFFGDSPVHIQDFGGSCLYPKIHTGYVKVVGTSYFKSCEPKIVDKMIKLYVDVNPLCPITVINAKIHVPATTTSATKMPPTIKSPPKDTSEASFPIWGYIIIIVGIIILIVILIICFIAYHLYKTHQPSKPIPPNVDETKPKPTVSNAKIAIAETPTNQKLKLAKEVKPNMNNENKSKKSQKKGKKKKTKTQEPTTVEDVSTVSHQQSTAEAVLPFKQPTPSAAYNPEVKHLIPRTMKSAKTNSFDERLKNDKSLMMESESVKF